MLGPYPERRETGITPCHRKVIETDLCRQVCPLRAGTPGTGQPAGRGGVEDRGLNRRQPTHEEGVELMKHVLTVGVDNIDRMSRCDIPDPVDYPRDLLTPD